MLIKPSTREFWKRANTIKGYPLAEKIQGFFYLRWPHFYIATATGSNWLGKLSDKFSAAKRKIFPPAPRKPGQISFADTYHGKVVPLQAARELVSVKENICISDLEKVIPYELARTIVLDHPDHIVALDCPCRVARENPCLPLDVCLIVVSPLPVSPWNTTPSARGKSPALKPWRSLKPKTNADMCTTPSLKKRCWNVFTLFATAAPAAAAPCRRTGTAP